MIARVFAPPRRWLRKFLFNIARRFCQTDDARQMLAQTLGAAPLGFGDRGDRGIIAPLAAVPYDDIGLPTLPGAREQKEAIIITARFRTGSTMLWNLFRHVPGCTAYYEPFNERRWFDAAGRGERLDASHKNVADYWREYDGLNELGRYYRDEWWRRDLFMEADHWAPDMKRYVACLIERAPGHPVLQFNRIDFRLPWFRKSFPRARIVHLYRHPRDQWCSTLKDIRCFPADGPAKAFAACDKFYLGAWIEDLKYRFPFLADPAEQHPYRSFYFLWRLSYLAGTQYSDYSVGYERLTGDPAIEIEKLMSFLGLRQADPELLRSLVAPPEGKRWMRYASDDWFKEHESYCEHVLESFLSDVAAMRCAELDGAAF